MAANDNGNTDASLALSDIIHTRSPTPVPLGHEDSTPKPGVERATSPEPITEDVVASFRKRLIEMGLSTDGTRKRSDGVNISSREEELLDMVISLTRSPLISPAQLSAQAEMIANLQFQRERVAQELEQEHERWAVEKYGWERMAEALIVQRNRPGFGGTMSEELERRCSTLECDNKILKDRLQESLQRNAALEAEINKLKPVLLMLPLVSGSNGKGKKRRLDSEDREKTPTASSSSQPMLPRTVFTKPAPSTSTSNVNQASSSTSTTATATTYRNPYEYYYSVYAARSTLDTQRSNTNWPPYTSNRINIQQNVPSSSTAHASASTPIPSTSRPIRQAKEKRRSPSSQALSSDARTEHLLLAARKIGRERAAALAGLAQHAEKEKENAAKERDANRAAKEAERLERERLERLKSGTGGGQYYRNVAPAVASSSAAREEQPGTPKRLEPQPPLTTMAHQQATGPQTTFVYVQTPGHSNSAAVAAPSRPTALPNTDQPRPHVSGADKTPRQSHVALAANGKSNGLPQTPHRQQAAGHPQQEASVQTPLDSLLRAARNMMSDGTPPEGNGSGHVQTSPGGRRRVASEMEEPESPAPAKRRKTATGGAGTRRASTSRQASSAVARRSAPHLTREARVPSALDVLADQAQVAAALPDGRMSHPQTSNARAEVGQRLDGPEMAVGMGQHQASTSGRRTSTRGRGIGRGRGRGRGRGGKGKAGESERNLEEPISARRKGGPGSDGESEIDPADGQDKGQASPGGSTAASIPANPPERRKRGRPRKSDQMAAAPVSSEVKEEPGSTAAHSAAPLSAATTSTSGRRKAARSASTAGGLTSVTKKSGRGGARGKGSVAGTSAASPPLPQQTLLPPGPRIIAPPAEPFDNRPASKPTLSPLDEALAQYEREKQLANQRVQLSVTQTERASSGLRAEDHTGFEKDRPVGRTHPEEPTLVDKDNMQFKHSPMERTSKEARGTARDHQGAISYFVPPTADGDVVMKDAGRNTVSPPPARPTALSAVHPTSVPPQQGIVSHSIARADSNRTDSNVDAEHESEVDGEAEVEFYDGQDEDADGDDDLDAEGEDEDERDIDGATGHVSFSSSDISKLLQHSQTVPHDDDDEDAEGEVEDGST